MTDLSLSGVDSTSNLPDISFAPTEPGVLAPVSFINLNKVSLNALAKQLPDGATVADQPIQISIRANATLSLLPPPLVIEDVEVLQRRAIPNIVVTLPFPAIANGRPIVPKYWGQMQSSMAAVQGSTHIHAIADPDPKWNPATSGWYTGPTYSPPPASSGVGQARWTVNSLPDPSGFSNGYYWLGEPSSSDYTQGITQSARLWRPDGSTPNAPPWRSIYPYKPSVRNHVNYGPGGRILTITKGVRFNLHFVEHMWLDWGHSMPQPFTWVIAGIIMDYPSNGYVHTILDSGRDPRQVGFPAHNENDLGYEERINDGLSYRNLLQVNVNRETMATALNPTGGNRIQTIFNMTARPRMFFGVFNGDKSLVGNYSGDGKHVQAGKLATGQQHRYYVLGRQHGYMGINHASHLVVFEMRFWHSALSLAQLSDQYGQLSSTWKFSQYR